MSSFTDWLRMETRGERGRVLAYALVALFGAVMSFVVVTGLGGAGRPLFAPLSRYEVWVIVAGAAGGLGGLYLTDELMGVPGRAGWQRAVIGVLMLSFSGSVIAGTLALPLYGTMFGPFSLVVTLFGSPALAVLWFGCLFSAHRLMVRWKAERESIFRPLEDLQQEPPRRTDSPYRKKPGEPMALREAEVRALLGLDMPGAPMPVRPRRVSSVRPKTPRPGSRDGPT